LPADTNPWGVPGLRAFQWTGSLPVVSTGPTLSIVMPVYNEPTWVTGSLNDVAVAVAAAPFTDVEIVVVDDGSTDATASVLDELELTLPLRVIHQQNKGRFEARRTGIEAARGDYVLLIDSRVSIRPDALAFVAGAHADGGEVGTWNAHVDMDLDGNPFARFWNVLTEASFARYFDDPRTTSFGLEDFDHFPKGTTCFLVRRSEMLAAIAEFRSHFSDMRNANDDTNLIRILASGDRINISPGFSCTYSGRSGLRPFLRHARHRGVVFVDGFLRPGTRFLPALLAFYPASVGVAAWALRSVRRLVALPLAAGVLFAAAGVAKRRGWRDVLVLAVLGPPWLLAYGAGVWQGLGLMLRGRRVQ